MSEHSIVKSLQNNVLEMMKWFHQFCVDNELRYYAICGTLLGAVRHNGFIPWDDDIDVAMPRSDYNRLISIMTNTYSDRYVFESPYTEDESYCYPISKIYDTHTTLIERKRHNFTRGVFIDVFPLDGVGDNYDLGLKHFKKIRRMYNFFLSQVCDYRNERSYQKNVAIFISRLIPQKMVSIKKLRERIDLLCQKYDFDNSLWCGAYLTAWGAKEIMQKEVFGTPTLYKFEDTVIFGVEKPNEYLKNIYGNWKELPPKEKQVSNHDFALLDLNNPYKKNN